MNAVSNFVKLATIVATGMLTLLGGDADGAPGDRIGSHQKLGQGGVNNHDPYFEDFGGFIRLTNGSVVAGWNARENSSATPPSSDGDAYGAFFKIYSTTGTAITSVPVAPYLDINPSGTGTQTAPILIPLAGGGFAAAWNSIGGPGDTYDLFGFIGGDSWTRVYTAAGAAVAGTTRVNEGDPTGTADGQYPAAGVGLTGGNYAVVWLDDNDQTGNTDDIFVRVFNASTGAAVNPSVQLGSNATHGIVFQDFGSFGSSGPRNGIVALSDGGFVVAWRSRDSSGDGTGTGPDGAGYGAFFQVFNADGTARSAVIFPYADINPSGTGSQNTPILAALTGGSFAIAWNSANGPGDVGAGSNQASGGDTYVRVFNNMGVGVSATSQVNDVFTADEQTPSGLIPLIGGGFVVAWNDDENVGNTDDPFVRAYTAAGAATGPSVQLGGAAHENLFQDFGNLAALDDGGFAVGWRTRDSTNNGMGTSVDGEGYASCIQVFNANGTTRTGTVFPYLDINPGGTGSQNTPQIAPVTGGFAVTWNSTHGPGDQGDGFNSTSGGDCYNRLYANNGTAITGTIRTHTSEPTGTVDIQTPTAIVETSSGGYSVVFRDDNEYTGNKDDFYISFFEGVATTPTVTSINPASGPTGGGTSITITGTNFTGATAVKFGATNAATFSVTNATTITATSPAGTGIVDVTVTTPSGTSATSAADQFTYVAPNLSINDVSLSEGNSGTTTFSFTVSLSTPAGPGGVTFDIATANGTATAPGDYAAKSLAGQTIPVNTSTYTFDVLVNGDTSFENNETFFVNVSNVTGASVTDGQGQGTIVNDDVATADLSVTVNDAPDPVVAGNNLSYTVNFTNNGPDASQTVTVTDAVPANTTFVSASVTSGSGWSTSAPSVGGTGNVVFSKASVAGSETATFTVVVKVDAATTIGTTVSNTATAASATTDPTPGNNSATATTPVQTQADLSIAISDSTDPVTAGAPFSYTLAVNNGGPSSAANVSVTCTLPTGVGFVSGSGSGWSVGESGGVVTCTRSSLAVGAAPSITLNVTAPVSAGTATCSASVGSGTTDNVPGNNSDMESTTVTAPPAPGFSMSFSPDTISAGETSTLTFTIDNTSSFVAASNLAFTDNLPSGVMVADTPNAFTTATGGTLTAASGSSTISFSGGSVAAGSNCTVKVDVTSSTAGTFVNTTGDLTSSAGNSGTAQDTLTVTEAPSLVVTTTDDTENNLDGVTSLREAMNYANSKANADANTPDEITFASPLFDSAQTIQLASTLPYIDEDLEITGRGADLLTVRGEGSNAFYISGGRTAGFSGLTVSNANSGIYHAGSMATVTNCAFSGNNIGIAGYFPANVTNVTFSGNSTGILISGAASLTNCTFSGNTNSGINTSGTPNVTNCTLSGNVQGISNSSGTATLKNSLVVGNGTNLDGVGTFDDDGSNITTGTAAEAGLDPDGLQDNGGPTQTISLLPGSPAIDAGNLAFDPDDFMPPLTTDQRGLPRVAQGLLAGAGPVIDIGAFEVNLPTLEFTATFTGPTTATGTTTLTYTVTNTGTLPATDLAFTHDLDAILTGLVATDTPLTDPCGTGSALTGTSTLAFTGGSLAASDSCQFSVTVQVPNDAAAGTYPGVTSELTADGHPVAYGASASLQIEPAPTFTKNFSPDTIVDGDVTTLVFTIDHTASTLAATDLDFNDSLPAGLVVASPANVANSFGGTVTATSGTGTISMTGGTIAAGASGTLSVDVTSNVPGDHVNTTGDLTSSSGNSGTATDTLTVNAAAALTITITRDPDPVRAGGTLTYTVTVTNNGPSTAENVVVTTGLPSGTSLIATTGAAEDPVGLPTASLGSILAGGSAQFTIEVLVDRDQFAPFDLTATVTSSTLDRDGSEISESASLEVLAQIFRPDLLFGDKSDPTRQKGDGDYGPGQKYKDKTLNKSVQFFVTAQNDGNVPDRLSTVMVGVSHRDWRVSVMRDGIDLSSSQFLAEGDPVDLARAAVARYEVKIRPRGSRPPKKFGGKLMAISMSDTSQSDEVRFSIKFKKRRVSRPEIIKPTKLTKSSRR